MDKFGGNIRMISRVPKVLSGAMGDTMFVAIFKTKEELKDFYYEMTCSE